LRFCIERRAIAEAAGLRGRSESEFLNAVRAGPSLSQPAAPRSAPVTATGSAAIGVGYHDPQRRLPIERHL
jgi:hypothetical protein